MAAEWGKHHANHLRACSHAHLSRAGWVAALPCPERSILVFPNIVKAGFIVGAATGDGVLFEDGLPASYYNISAGAYGLQAGVQSFNHTLFFMTASALNYLAQSQGWAVGTGPSVVVLDHSKAASVTSTNLAQDVYALPFGAKGLMAGLGIKGSKLTPISPGP